MNQNLEWKIWYSNGSTFSNLEGIPADAPILGVQCIARWTFSYHSQKMIPKLLSGRSCYIWNETLCKWSGHEAWDSELKIGLICKRGQRIGALLKGEELEDPAEIERIKAEALEDCRGWRAQD